MVCPRAVKALVFPVVMYGCERWTIKKSEHQRIDAFELWCLRRLFRVPWTARRSNQSIHDNWKNQRFDCPWANHLNFLCNNLYNNRKGFDLSQTEDFSLVDNLSDNSEEFLWRSRAFSTVFFFPPLFILYLGIAN